jgi:hypothetical protein
VKTMLDGPVTEMGGMPFLDDEFASRRLLAAVAAVRHVTAGRRGMATGISDGQAEAWLAPARVFMLRRDSPPMPAVPLGGTRRQQITTTLGELADAIPAWADLLRLPVRYALLHPPNGAISASSRAWPQHVLLAGEAFTSGRELREQLVHELCHQWLYLIQEVWVLAEPGSAHLTLPSGTTGRTPDEVLGAAHVAAALTRMYHATGDGVPGRAGALASYGTGCLAKINGPSSGLTDAGRQIARGLKEAL